MQWKLFTLSQAVFFMFCSAPCRVAVIRELSIFQTAVAVVFPSCATVLIASFPYSPYGCIYPCLVRGSLMTVLLLSTACFFSAKNSSTPLKSGNHFIPGLVASFESGLLVSNQWTVGSLDTERRNGSGTGVLPSFSSKLLKHNSSSFWLVWLRLGWNLLASHCLYLLLYEEISGDCTQTPVRLKKPRAHSRSMTHLLIAIKPFQKNSSSSILRITYVEF